MRVIRLIPCDIKLKPMKKNSAFFLIVVQVIVMTICLDAFSQNPVAPVSGDDNWDEQFGSTGMNGEVNCLVKKDGILYAGGEYTKAGGNDINRIAQWDGTSWSPVGVGFDQNAVHTIEFYDSELYAGGIFYRSDGQNMKYFAKFNGTAWVQPGAELDHQVDRLSASEDFLYLGGSFISFAGIELNEIAIWDGAQFHSLAGGLWLSQYDTPNVFAIEISGNDVYVGGIFTKAGGVNALNIARWDGTSWSPLGGGIDCEGCIVTSIALIGNDLYAAGSFSVAGGVNANNIARWDGTQWSPLGSGTNAAVSALEVIGDKLYAGGFFTSAGGVSAQRIAMWDGTQWSALGSGMNEWVKTLYADGDILYAGGRFTRAGNKTAKYIARWGATLSVEEQEADSGASLFRNSPNPFSGSTEITYQLNKAGNVQLSITDLTGRELEILIDEMQLPGEQQLTYDANGLPAGIYFMKLVVDYQRFVYKIIKL